MPQYDPNELLLPSLLGMDVYHRDEIGGLKTLVNSLPYIDGATALGQPDVKANIGFFAKAYEKDGTTYIVYRGTDDGSLDIISNARSIEASLFFGSNDHPDLYYGYTAAIGSLSSLGSSRSPHKNEHL